jgi:Zn-dependent protease
LDYSYNIAVAVIWLAIFFLLSGPVHESAHAFAAWKMGDGTAKMFGRISLDPVRHFDPVGGGLLILSAVFVVLGGGGRGLGWAKPTPVNPYNLRGKHADSIVAAAGPLSNLGLAIIFAILLRFMLGQNYWPNNDNVPDMITLVFWVGLQLNIVLMIFNLIPVPPLDGSHVLLDFVSPRTAMELRGMFNQYGLLVLVAVIFFAGAIITPIMNPIVRFLAGI